VRGLRRLPGYAEYILKNAEIFDRRITALHAAGMGGAVMDVRHEEFMAMADAFLGQGFGRAKLAQIESLQFALHEGQAELSKALAANLLEPTDYVDAVNRLHARTAQQCETIVGAHNFLMLFGVPPAEAGAYIDKEQFLARA
jgi:GNAT superfamily N-acetyltransferase